MTIWLLLISTALVAISGAPGLLLSRRSRLGQQIAAVLNLCGATVAGAAMLAGIGTGVLVDATASRAWQKPGSGVHRHDPDPRSHVRLDALLLQRRTLYSAERAARPG